MKLGVPRPSTVQPALYVIDTERSPRFHQKLSRSDVTTTTFRPSTISESLFQTVLFHRASSFNVSHRPTNAEASWIEHIADKSASVFPLLSVNTTCAICGEMLVDVGKLQVQPCEHMYCKPCLTAYFEQRILDCEVLKIPCPTFECTSVLGEEQLQSLVAPELFEKYVAFKRNSEIESNPHMRHCPKPNCSGYAEGGADRSQVKCTVCGHWFCFYCLEPWHESQPCNAERDRLLDCWAKTNNVKFCPNCRRHVEKMSGCDHMTCVKCRYDWCWKCGQEYSSNHPDQCEVTKLRKRNPPWPIALAMLLAPLLFPLAFVILVLYYLEELLRDIETREDQHSFLLRLRSRWVSYPVIITLALVLTPLAFMVVVLFGGCILLLECRTYISESDCCICNATRSRCTFVFLSLLLGISLSPIVLFALLLAIIILHLAGLWFLLFKVYIVIRRRFEPTYLQPRGAPGYL